MRMLRLSHVIIVSLVLAGSVSASLPILPSSTAPSASMSRKPSVNAALYYFRAFLLTPSTEHRHLHNNLPQTYPLNRRGLRYLHAAEGALHLLHSAAKMPYCDWGYDFRHDPPNMPVPELSKAQLLVQIALLDARYQWSKHNYSAAARDVRDSFILAHRVGRGGTSLGPLVEWNIDFEIENVVAEKLYLLPPQAMANLQRVLSQAAPPTSWAWEWAKESAFNLIRWVARSGHMALLWRAENYGRKSTAPLPADFRQQVQAAIPLIDRFERRRLAAFRQPYPKTLAAIRKADAWIEQQAVREPKNSVLATCADSARMDQYLYQSQCLATARFAMLRGALAYVCGGQSAFDTIRDPFGPGRLRLLARRAQILVSSHLVPAAIGINGANYSQFWRLIIPLCAGGVGRAVEGHLTWAADSRPPSGESYDLYAQLTPQLRIPYPRHWFFLPSAQRKAWRSRWFKSRDGHRYLGDEGILLELHPFGPNGRFFKPAVAPGEYTLFYYALIDHRLTPYASAVANVTVAPATSDV